jgi:hypothetical protein
MTGRVFRVGYYSKMDGLDCIWLVDETGHYEQTIDHECLNKFFEVQSLGKERSLYGRGPSQDFCDEVNPVIRFRFISR